MVALNTMFGRVVAFGMFLSWKSGALGHWTFVLEKWVSRTSCYRVFGMDMWVSWTSGCHEHVVVLDNGLFCAGGCIEHTVALDIGHGHTSHMIDKWGS